MSKLFHDKWPSKKAIAITLLTACFTLLIVACASGSEVVEVTREVVVTQQVVVTVQGEDRIITEEVFVEVPIEITTTPEPTVATTDIKDLYVMAIFEDPLTLNTWAQLGPDSSVWTSYVLNGMNLTMYGLSDQRNDFIPILAADLPPEPVEEEDGTYSITVTMQDGPQWSDGQPIDANDVVFTLTTCLDLVLTGNWNNLCQLDVLDRVEMVDDLTVKYFFNSLPGLSQWQFGVAGAPILPEHAWGDVVAEARTFIEGVELPADCGEEATEEELEACEAYENARKTLYGATLDEYLTAGGLQTDQLESGAFARRTLNENAFFNGTNIIQYDDGTYQEIFANGDERTFYGEGGGEETLNFVRGPYVKNVIFSIYGSQDAAFLALNDGEVDMVLNPLGGAPGFQPEAGVSKYTNPDNGVFYFAFNLRKEPFSDIAFRTAVDILTDKEFVAERILQSSVFPAYSVVPPGNEYWHKTVETPYVGLSREERINLAVETLLAAGYSWDVEPMWSEESEDVIPGDGFRLPDGSLMEEAVLLGPGPSYDPQRAVFNQWMVEWMSEAGIPVKSELAGFNTILTPVFEEASFDMYILGWSLGIYPNHLCNFFDSRNDTLANGGFNTTGFNDPEYDALCDEFTSATDVEAARDIAYQLQDTLALEKPYINLFYRQAIDYASANVEFPYTDTLGGIADQAGFQFDATLYK